MDKNIQYNIPVLDKNIDIAKKNIERYFYDIIKKTKPSPALKGGCNEEKWQE